MMGFLTKTSSSCCETQVGEEKVLITSLVEAILL